MLQDASSSLQGFAFFAQLLSSHSSKGWTAYYKRVSPSLPLKTPLGKGRMLFELSPLCLAKKRGEQRQCVTLVASQRCSFSMASKILVQLSSSHPLQPAREPLLINKPSLDVGKPVSGSPWSKIRRRVGAVTRESGRRERR